MSSFKAIEVNGLQTYLRYVFICTFAWKRYKLTIGDEDTEETASVERDAYKYIAEQISVLQPSFWLKLAGVAMAKYFFTTLAGVDWMMVEIGKQRRYEILMEISKKIKALETSGTAVRYPQGLKTEVERLENLQAAEERLLRLDCVFYILYDEVPMHVVEEEEVNPHVPSMRRRTTVLAPAVSGLLGDVEMEQLERPKNDKELTTPDSAPTPVQSPQGLPTHPTSAPNLPHPTSEPDLPHAAEAQKPSGPGGPSALDTAWSFFFGLRVPESRPHSQGLAPRHARSLAQRPGHGWPPPPTETFPNSPGWRPQAPLISDWTSAGSSQYNAPLQPFPAHWQPSHDANQLLPPQWQTSLGQTGEPSSASWARHTVAPGQHLRPHF